jgi:type IV pilus assembly protein PilB
MRRTHGALLVTGPTGSGKTTTLYAMIAELNVPERAILTIEDPVEYALPGVKQVQVNVKRGLTFAAGLRTMLRSDPDVLMVGEIRDRETAQIGVEAALTGRLVLSTLHTNDAATAVTRLTEMGIERYLVASSVECIVASRLARVLCEECKRPSPVTEEELRDSGLGAGREPFVGFEAVGCPRCGDTGYRGRIGLFEVLEMDDDVRALVIDRYPSRAVEDHAIERGMSTLRDSAVTKVRAGVVSLSEAARVTAE